MHKVGTFQHWKDDWHSQNSQRITQQSFLFVEDVIKTFISSRNSFNSHLVDIDFCWDQINLLDCEVKNEDHNSLILNVRQQRAKRFMRLITGRVVFLRYNNWLIILVYLFIPKLLRKIIKPFNNDYLKTRQIIKNQWLTTIDYQNNYIFNVKDGKSYDNDIEFDEYVSSSCDESEKIDLTPEELDAINHEKKLKFQAFLEKKKLKNTIKENIIKFIEKKNMYIPKTKYINKIKPEFFF